MKTRFESTPDAWIAHAWRESATAVEPTDAVDRRILARAEVACHDNTKRSGWWVWPVSVAAALVLCAGLIVQMVALMEDDTTVVVMQPGTPDTGRDLPAQRIGGTTTASEQTQNDWGGVLVDGGATLVDREPVAAALLQSASRRELSIAELEVAEDYLVQSASEGDVVSFSRLLEMVSAQPEFASGNRLLPGNVRQFAQTHGLELQSRSAD